MPTPIFSRRSIVVEHAFIEALRYPVDVFFVQRKWLYIVHKTWLYISFTRRGMLLMSEAYECQKLYDRRGSVASSQLSVQRERDRKIALSTFFASPSGILYLPFPRLFPVITSVHTAIQPLQETERSYTKSRGAVHQRCTSPQHSCDLISFMIFFSISSYWFITSSECFCCLIGQTLDCHLLLNNQVFLCLQSVTGGAF